MKTTDQGKQTFEEVIRQIIEISIEQIRWKKRDTQVEIEPKSGSHYNNAYTKKEAVTDKSKQPL